MNNSSRANLSEESECCNEVEPRSFAQLCSGEMPESPMPMPDKIRKITIEQLDFGYIAKVGCQTFAIETIEKLMTNLTAYLQDPSVIENNWNTTKKLK